MLCVTSAQPISVRTDCVARQLHDREVTLLVSSRHKKITEGGQRTVRKNKALIVRLL